MKNSFKEQDMDTSIIRVPMGKSNSYLIKGKDGFILVDGGMQNKSRNIQNALNKLNAKFDDINLIIVTHVHYDHVGSLHDIKKRSNAPVLVHEKEKELLQRGWSKFPHGTLAFSKIISNLGNRFLSAKARFEPVQADIVVKDNYDLSEYGLEGEVIHTPGHTEGSVCVVVEGKYCIAGDTLFNILPNSVYPPFANDEKKLMESWAEIRKQNYTKYYPGHGREFALDKFDKTFKKHAEG